MYMSFNKIILITFVVLIKIHIKKKNLCYSQDQIILYM